MSEDDKELLHRAVADRQADPLSIREWQRVNQMIGDPVAWEAEPVALLALRKRRDSRSRLRNRATSGSGFGG